MQDKQNSSRTATQVVPCPRYGYRYITLVSCQACVNHVELQNLMEKGPATGRRVDQVACSYPAKRPIEVFIDDGYRTNVTFFRKAVLCPRHKSLVLIKECRDCELHRGMYKEGPSGFITRWLNRILRRKAIEKVLCGIVVGRQCNYVTEGIGGK